MNLVQILRLAIVILRALIEILDRATQEEEIRQEKGS
jgi:hypothetical protein